MSGTGFCSELGQSAYSKRLLASRRLLGQRDAELWVEDHVNDGLNLVVVAQRVPACDRAELFL